MRTALGSSYYQVGGALAKEAFSYVRRQEDRDLYESMVAGEHCFVFGPPQIGKSSLCLQTMGRLRASNITCCLVALPTIGCHLTAEEWYLGIIRQLEHDLALPVDALHWWQEHAGLSPLQRLDEFLTELLETMSHSLALLLDNAERILQLEWREDFLAFLYYCYERRGLHSKYKRLTFALFGAATPDQFGPNPYFSISRAVALANFERRDVEPLVSGLKERSADPQAVLNAIWHWTGGQPFLTQMLCQLVLASPEIPDEAAVEQIVRSQVVEKWEHAEVGPLRILCDCLLDGDSNYRLLRLYSRWQRGDVTHELVELERLGLIVRQEQHWEIANRLYQEVFGREWTERQLALRSAEPLYAGPDRGAVEAPFLLPPWTESSPSQAKVVATPDLRQTRTARLGLTLLLVSLIATAGAAVVAQNTNQKLDDASKELAELEETKIQTAAQLEQTRAQLEQTRQERGRLDLEREKLQEQIEQAKRDRTQAQRQAQQARAARQKVLEQLERSNRQQQREN